MRPRRDSPARGSTRLRLTGALMLAAALAGCSGATSPAPTPTPSPSPTPTPTATLSPRPSASSSPEFLDTGVTLTLPANWHRVGVTEAALRDYLATAGTSSPELASILDQILSSGAYRRLEFLAFGYDGVTYVGNVNIDANEAQGYTLDELLSATEATLSLVGATGIASSRVVLPAGDALRVKYSITTTVKQTGATYLLVEEGTIYQVTFWCLAAPANTCLKQAATMVRTLTIAP